MEDFTIHARKQTSPVPLLPNCNDHSVQILAQQQTTKDWTSPGDSAIDPTIEHSYGEELAELCLTSVKTETDCAQQNKLEENNIWSRIKQECVITEKSGVLDVTCEDLTLHGATQDHQNAPIIVVQPEYMGLPQLQKTPIDCFDRKLNPQTNRYNLHEVSEHQQGLENQIQVYCQESNQLVETIEIEKATSRSPQIHTTVDSYGHDVKINEETCEEQQLRAHHQREIQYKGFMQDSCKKDDELEKSGNGQPNAKLYTCKHCEQDFATVYRLRVHQILHVDVNARKSKQHISLLNIKRKPCEESSDVSNADFQQEPRLSVSSWSPLLATMVYNCFRCSQAFHDKLELQKHMFEKHPSVGKLKCSLCDKLFVNQRALLQHTSSQHSQQISITGSVCRKVCGTKSQLLSHKQRSKTEKLHKSGTCYKQYKQSFQLKSNKLSHTRPTQHKCYMCHKSFNFKHTLTRHLRGVHEVKKPFSCSICSEAFSSNRDFKLHESSHQESKQHKCLLCDARFKQLRQLIAHEKMHDSKKKKHESGQRNKMYSNRNHLQHASHSEQHASHSEPHASHSEPHASHSEPHASHSEQHASHSEQHASNSEPHASHSKHAVENVQHCCRICNQNFETYKEVREHVKLVHKQSYTTHKCTSCEQSFPSRHALKKHTLEHSREKQHQCELCLETFSHWNFMIQHIYSEHETKYKKDNYNYPDLPVKQCSYCEEKFKVTARLKDHEAIHTGMKWYKCSTCLKEFKYERYLVRHIRREHVGQRQYTCSVCQVQFESLSTLEHHSVRHLHQHYGYTCRHCDEKFSSRKLLYMHLTSVHPRSERFGCKYCTKKFMNQDEAVEHEATHASDIKCTFCDEYFPSEYAHHIHLDNVHAGQCPYICSTCKQNFKFNCQLLAHRCNVRKGGIAFALKRFTKSN